MFSGLCGGMYSTYFRKKPLSSVICVERTRDQRNHGKTTPETRAHLENGEHNRHREETPEVGEHVPLVPATQTVRC